MFAPTILGMPVILLAADGYKNLNVPLIRKGFFLRSNFILTVVCFLFFASSSYGKTTDQSLLELEWSFKEYLFSEKERQQTQTELVAARKQSIEVLINLMKNQCSACQFQELASGSWRIELPAGFEFIVSQGPSGISFKTRPVSLSQINVYRDTLQILVWGNARAIGLKPNTLSIATTKDFEKSTRNSFEPETLRETLNYYLRVSGLDNELYTPKREGQNLKYKVEFINPNNPNGMLAIRRTCPAYLN